LALKAVSLTWNIKKFTYQGLIIFFADYTSTDAEDQHARTLIPEHIRKIVPAHLEIDEITTTGASLFEIDEVTTGASLSTSPTTESTTSLNPEINPEKCKHPC
jgi:hypothetical protein